MKASSEDCENPGDPIGWNRIFTTGDRRQIVTVSNSHHILDVREIQLGGQSTQENGRRTCTSPMLPRVEIV
jgi:hypothetical protein